MGVRGPTRAELALASAMKSGTEDSIAPRSIAMNSAGSYGFEYSDEDMSTGAVDIENEYYKAKGVLQKRKVLRPHRLRGDSRRRAS